MLEGRSRMARIGSTCLALALVLTIASAAQAINIVTGGFNVDEVYDIATGTANAPVDTGTDALGETGFKGLAAGLPTTGSFTSATGSGVTYVLQPYNANNALRMGNGNPNSGSLTVAPGFYNNLYILATSGNAGSSGVSDITLFFSDLSSSLYANALNAPDWYDASGNPTAAITGMGRVSFPSGNIDTNFPTSPFALYETTLSLTGLDQTKVLTSIGFNLASGAAVTNVYAVDSIDCPVPAVPLPPTVLLLGSGIVGLVGLRRFRKR
jgi:hypothetical protein